MDTGALRLGSRLSQRRLLQGGAPIRVIKFTVDFAGDFSAPLTVNNR